MPDVFFKTREDLSTALTGVTDFMKAVLKKATGAEDELSTVLLNSSENEKAKNVALTYLRSKGPDVLQRCLAFVRLQAMDYWIGYCCRVHGTPNSPGAVKEVESYLLQLDLLETTFADTLKATAPELQLGTASLIIVDPPFGLEKGKGHEEGDWDTDAWDGEAIKVFMNNMDPLTLPQATIAVYAPYCAAAGSLDCTGCIHVWMNTLRELGWVNPQTLVFVKDDTAWSQGARLASDVTQQVLIMFKPSGAVQHFNFTDPEDSILGANPLRFFLKPGNYSKFGRAEVDAIVMKGDKALNPTQKSVEAMRWLVRHFGRSGAGLPGMVVSACDGTGTATVAALLEGRNVIAFEKSASQVELSSHRVNRLLANENSKVQVFVGAAEKLEVAEPTAVDASSIDKFFEKVYRVPGGKEYLSVGGKVELISSYLAIQEASFVEHYYLSKTDQELFTIVVGFNYPELEAVVKRTKGEGAGGSGEQEEEQEEEA